jgi:hypothetical protein
MHLIAMEVAAMTRPLTRHEHSVLTGILAQSTESRSALDFIVERMTVGAGIGFLVGVILLVNNAFGIASLLQRVSDPLCHVVIFLMGGAIFFAPLTLAVSMLFLPDTRK